jgi:hypothetical protein
MGYFCLGALVFPNYQLYGRVYKYLGKKSTMFINPPLHHAQVGGDVSSPPLLTRGFHVAAPFCESVKTHNLKLLNQAR